MMIVGNPDARGNIQAGRKAYETGARDREAVLRAHLRWNRGTAADLFFATGYRGAAKAAGESREAILEWLIFVESTPRELPPHMRTRRLEIMTEERNR